ncbi:hypothetical protein H8D36_05770 [archaeon]|nr:hypothetical protein [archaeon]MBL7057055.1 hypothetical protein [Candidatus Woesearchaeota archaeon]
MKEYKITKVSFEDGNLWIFFANVGISVNFVAYGKEDSYHNSDAAEKMKKGDTILLEGMLGDEPTDFLGIGTVKSVFWQNPEGENTPVYLSTSKVHVAPNSFLSYETYSKLRDYTALFQNINNSN